MSLLEARFVRTKSADSTGRSITSTRGTSNWTVSREFLFTCGFAVFHFTFWQYCLKKSKKSVPLRDCFVLLPSILCGYLGPRLTFCTAALWFLYAAAGRTSAQLFIPSDTPSSQMFCILHLCTRQDCVAFYTAVFFGGYMVSLSLSVVTHFCDGLGGNFVEQGLLRNLTLWWLSWMI
jgi:hypothetical protein